MKTIITLAIGVLLSASVNAQSVLIKNATVHTAGAQGTLKNTDVLVQDGSIRAIGKNLLAPTGVPVFDAQEKSLTPGLFGGINNLGVEEISLEESTVDANFSALSDGQKIVERLYPEFDLSLAYNPRSSLIPIARVAGITYTALAPDGSVISGQGGVMRLQDNSNAPVSNRRLMFLGIGHAYSGGSGKSRAAQYMLLEHALDEARLTGGEEKLLSYKGRAALNRAATQSRLLVRVQREADIRQVLSIAQRRGLRIGIVGGAEAWRVARELAAANVPVFVDGLQNLPSDFDQLASRLDNAALLQKAGVDVAIIQAGDPTHNARKIRQNAGNAVANGLPWEAGLAAITSAPADALGVADQIGRIQAGLKADLVLWSGDPLEVTSYANKLWVAGVDTALVSRQTLLRDRYLNRPAGVAPQYVNP
jgi:hypothetical protein